MSIYTKAKNALKQVFTTTTANTASEIPPPAVGLATADNSMVSSGSVNQDYAGLFDQLINKDPNSSATGMALNAEILQGLSGQGSSALHNAKRMGAEMLSRKAQDLRGQAGEQISQAGLIGQGTGNSIGNKAEGAILQATADLGNNIAQQASTEQMAAQKMALDKGALDESSRDNTLSKLLQNKSANQSAAQDLYKQYADARDKGDTANAAMIDKKYIEMTGFSADQIQAGKTAGAEAAASNAEYSKVKNILGGDANALDNAIYNSESNTWTINGTSVSDPAAMDAIATEKSSRDLSAGKSVQALEAKISDKGLVGLTETELTSLPKEVKNKYSTTIDTDAVADYDLLDSKTKEYNLPYTTTNISAFTGSQNFNNADGPIINAKFGLNPDGSFNKMVLIDGKYYKASTTGAYISEDRGEDEADVRQQKFKLTPIDGGATKEFTLSGYNQDSL